MASLAELALAEPQIGAFSAFGESGFCRLLQGLLQQRLRPMHHRWAYGITQGYWQRTLPDYADYLAILVGTDYRTRPHDAVRAWIDHLGPDAKAVRGISSQDGARTAIMLKLGCFSVMTTPCYAMNVGKHGLHR